MKKFLSLMIAAIMLAGCVSFSMAEEAPEGFTAKVTLALQEDTIKQLMGGAEEAKEATKAIVKLMNSLSILATSDGVDSEISVLLEDNLLIQALVLKDDNGMVLHSNLFPNYAINVPNEEIGGLSGVPQLDVNQEKLMAEIEETYKGIFDKIAASISEPEAADVTFFDKHFDSRRSVDMSAKDIMTLLYESIGELVQKEEMASLLKQLGEAGVNVKVEDIMAQIDQLKEEEIPETSIDIYDNGVDTVLQILSAQSINRGENTSNSSFSIGGIGGVGTSTGTNEAYDETVKALIGNIDGDTVAQIESGEAQVEIKASKGIITLEGTGDAGGLPMQFNVSIVENENGTDIGLSLMANGSLLLSAQCSVTKGSAMTGNIPTEGKNYLPLQDISNPESENYAAFMTEVMNSVGGLLGKIMEAAPELAPLFNNLQAQ